MIRLRFACFLFLAIHGTASLAQIIDDPTKLADTIGKVALSGDRDAADVLSQRLHDGKTSIDQWGQGFQKYFSTGTFTVTLGVFWETAVTDADESDRTRIGVISALCASEAVKAALPRATQLPAAYESVATAFRWLQYALPVLDSRGRMTTFDALSKATGGNSLNAFTQRPQQYAFYVQAALTLVAYADARGGETVGKLLGLPAAPMAIWQRFGILVFDNGAFSAQHYASLASLLAAIPQRLHAIKAMIVPSATGIAAGTGFITSGQIVYLPYVPMNVYTSPKEFIDNGGPIAPQFTAIAAQEIVRAIQAVQFWSRPALIARRDIILANAGTIEARYLRHYRIVNPVTYMNNPDELLPALAYIYAIDSRTVFQMAIAFFQLNEKETVDQFLLLADLLSGGGSTTTLLSTSLAGEVASATATIGRVHGSWVRAPYPANAGILYNPAIPVDLWFCNRISYGHSDFVFAFDEHGITSRYVR